MNAKRRVRAGLTSQEAVSAVIKSEMSDAGRKVRVAKRAGYGQQSSDVVMVVDDVAFSVEVKGMSGLTKPVPLFDKSVRRRNVPQEIETMAEAFIETISVGSGRLSRILETEGYSKTFLGMIDFYRDKVDHSVGLAEDPNSAGSGKLPRDLSSGAPAVTRVARKMVLDNLKSSKDTYFAVHDKTDDTVLIWYTGYGPNVLQAPDFPRIKNVSMDTYGGSSKGATRVAIKIRFDV